MDARPRHGKGLPPLSESIVGQIVDISPSGLSIHAPYSNWERYVMRKYQEVEVILVDGRKLSTKQSNAIHAMVHDIANFTDGYAYKDRVFDEVFRELGLQYIIDTTDDEEIRYALQQRYCFLREVPFFSLSRRKENCLDMTTASDFLGWLIDMCVEHGIPCSDTLLNRAEDIGRYLYACIAHKRCAISGQKADLHHVDAVGMGRSRREITHKGMRAESLAREYHNEAHTIGQAAFDAKYHLHGIPMDDRLCEIHALKH